MLIRDRIKDLRRVPASALRPNPKNWRTHPTHQRDALRHVLADIGFADAALARELPDGSLVLIDGHMRSEVAGDAPVPVLVLDVTEAEADRLLATLDPLAGMARSDAEKLNALMHEVRDLDPMLPDLFPALAVASTDPAAPANTAAEHWQDMPAFDNPPASVARVVVLFRTEEDFAAFAALLARPVRRTGVLWFTAAGGATNGDDDPADEPGDADELDDA
jgi:hypothetical protein